MIITHYTRMGFRLLDDVDYTVKNEYGNVVREASRLVMERSGDLKNQEQLDAYYKKELYLMKLRNILMIIFAIMLIFSFTACGTGETNTDNSNNGFEKDSFDVSNAEIKEFANFLSENAYADAITQYNENIAGNAELESEAADCVKTFMENTAKGVLAGEYTEKEAKARNTTAEKIYTSTNCDVSEYDALTADIEQALNSKVAYESGVSLLTSKNYVDAIAEFEKVMETDSNYSDAMEKRTEAIDGYKAKVIGDADTRVTENDYPGAIDILKKAVKVLPDDSELLTKLNTSEKNYIAKTLTDAESIFTDYTKYEDALDIIRATLQYYPEDTSLIEKRDYYNSFAPVNLYDMSPVKGELETTKSATDTYNNTYTNCFYIGRGSNAFVYPIVYDLGAAYNNFSTTIYSRSSDTTPYEYSLVIEGDGKILYENYNIVDNGKPFDIKLDITGVDELTITMGRVASYKGAGYGMANTVLQRTAK